MRQDKVAKIKEELKVVLDVNRYEHTIGVMHMAGAMACRYRVNLEQAVLAGLLHDCAKCISKPKMLDMCVEYRISVSETEKQSPSLLHAKLGAYLAETKYGIKDREIQNAIAYHTTGCPDMTLLEKIIYIADYIELNRAQAPNLSQIRRLAFQDIDECLYRILDATIEYLKKEKRVIDSATEKAYLYYKDKRKEEKESL